MHVRLERSDGIFESILPESDRERLLTQVTVGPFEWVQLTYEELRVSPDGDVIAVIDDGDWYLVDPGSPRGRGAAALVSLSVTKADLSFPFSDVVVY